MARPCIMGVDNYRALYTFPAPLVHALVAHQESEGSPSTHPTPVTRPSLSPQTGYLISSGDLGESANTAGWDTQVQMEADVTGALGATGWTVIRGNDVDPATGHVDQAREGSSLFAGDFSGTTTIEAEFSRSILEPWCDKVTFGAEVTGEDRQRFRRAKDPPQLPQ